MQVLSAAVVDAALTYDALVPALRNAFQGDASAPPRHHHGIPVPGGTEATLLLMPAWEQGTYVGVKVATVFPDNPGRNLPSVQATYLLHDGATGTPVCQLAGQPMTNRRTAGASALAADYLARDDASRLLMVGTGAMAPELVDAHASVRPIREVRVWGRTPEKSRRLAAELSARGYAAEAVETLDAETVGWADVVSCATMAVEPPLHGEWLRPGQHVDLVGAFKPTMRETDDRAVQRARVFCDTYDGALSEGGDLVQPLQDGVITRHDVLADLYMLTRGQHPGRRSGEEITLFKSVGTALEDLAAAVLAYERAGEG
ncbi:ornithine cyclodeaminase [Limimonas halophila]|uniref:Ornithine cyclodeaminase n=1 Tax=Limimonas halophila TaxID=1082479 RepID=A0A1G7NIX4_9PROT|nr:ornithine cyclodeaminase family protein [Limimonas halophila]SDF73973.1 ornithine cyclodeaminase [Limimonas halophila]